MKVFEELVQKKLISLSVVLLIGFFYFQKLHEESRWNKQTSIRTDALGYYVYLPSVFIYSDLKYDWTHQLNAKYPNFYFASYTEGENGARYQKYPIGTSIMNIPFFLIAHQLALNSDQEADGYSPIYHKWISYGTVFYAVLALIMIAQVIGLFFSDLIAAITVLLIGLGTNYYYFAIYEPGLSHIPGLFVLGLYFYHCIKWFREFKFLNLFILTISLGIATVIRPTNILFGGFFILMLFQREIGFKKVIQVFKTYKYKWIMLLLSAILIPFLQISLWKYNSGNYIQYSYGEEGFFFTSPHIIYGLFSARNGLFLYSLPFFLSIYALFIRKKEIPTLFIFINLFVFYYVIYSWWCWWYGGSYGSRAAIESYVLLSILLATAIDFIWKQLIPAITLIFIISLFQISFTTTLSFSDMRRTNLVHYDAMTWEAYWYLWTKDGIGSDYFELWEHPDYHSSLKYGSEYIGFLELNTRSKYSEGVMNNYTNIPGDTIFVKFEFWGEDAFFGDPVIFLEVVCEDMGYYQKIPIKPEVKVMEWNSGIQSLKFDNQWINHTVHFRLIYEGKRRIFYRPIDVFTDRPLEQIQ
ncbi:MAG: hypothetical protein R2799_00605 [Crocinitomicaceae bacterium]